MAIINGTPNADSLRGTTGNDTIIGYGGNDTLLGDSGSDIIEGGTGDDSIDGGTGNDSIYGNDGNDFLSGSLGADLADGGAGDDYYYGFDPYIAGDGNDTVLGGAGNDQILDNSSGDDSIDGGDGNDNITVTGGYGSGIGNDTIFGGNGDDIIYTQYRTDGNNTFRRTLLGGDGNDTISIDIIEGGNGVSLIADGGTGSDTFSLKPPSYAFTGGYDITINNFQCGLGGDKIDLSGFLNTFSSIGGYTSGNPFNPSLGFLRLIQSGANTILQYDNDGASGSKYSWQNLAILTNTSSTAFTSANFVGGLSPDGASTTKEISAPSIAIDNVGITSLNNLPISHSSAGAVLLAIAPLNMLSIDFFQVYNGAINSVIGSNLFFNNRSYSNVLEVQWKRGDTYFDSIFGGDNITILDNGTKNKYITSGEATGYLELKWTGSSYDPQFVIQNISVSAASLYNSFLTSSNYDDIGIISSALIKNDLLIGSDGNDSLAGFLGNDVYYGGKGDDTFVDLMNNGGQDWVVYTNLKAEYNIWKDGEYYVVSDKVQSRDGADKLYFIDRIEFAGHSIVALDLDGNAGQAYRLYKAALNRTPDERGLASWIKFMDDGGAIVNMAQQFIDSSEFRTKYGALDNTGFINQLYQNVLSRNGEPNGVAGWVGGLNNGLSRADVLKGFSESSENQANVIGQIKNGIAYTEWWLT